MDSVHFRVLVISESVSPALSVGELRGTKVSGSDAQCYTMRITLFSVRCRRWFLMPKEVSANQNASMFDILHDNRVLK